ncbi:GNAT family N-acetyltransferase [Neobacillus muris]|uniref:GNAT family N-acetyltransferase n=1 Tax=Neobacillus muris TaxID=2941334 RepID=UPI00203C8154|nr:GNAT family N-acetyltransferase [Neobacillus muris]
MKQLYIISQNDIWSEVLKNFETIDCYYSYEYGNLFAKNEMGKLYAAYYEDDNAKIFYPFIKRKVPFIEEELYDIVTPYGYGGPFIQGSCQSVYEFYEMFGSYCQSHHIITETIRFHPFYDNYKVFEELFEIEYIRKTTGVDLTVPMHEIRNNYSSMNKRNIRKARANNLHCFIAEKNEQNIKNFIDLYKETMDRNKASSYYYFDDEYFFEQVKNTEISETYLLFTELNNRIIAGVLILVGKEFSHYHLGASRTEYLDLKPNNLLFDYMIEFCKCKGSSMLHLGGGYQEDDGLFKFKSSFTNHNHYNYFLGKKIHNEEKYNEIIDCLRLQYTFDENYFPSYRGDLKKKTVCY